MVFMTFFAMASRQRAALGATLALLLAASAPVMAQTPPPPADASAVAPKAPLDPSTVLATIDGQPVTAGDVAVATEDLEQSMASMTEDQRKDYALNYLIDLKL